MSFAWLVGKVDGWGAGGRAAKAAEAREQQDADEHAEGDAQLRQCCEKDWGVGGVCERVEKMAQKAGGGERERAAACSMFRVESDGFGNSRLEHFC